MTHHIRLCTSQGAGHGSGHTLGCGNSFPLLGILGAAVPCIPANSACLTWAWRAAPSPLCLHRAAAKELFLSEASQSTGCRYELRCIIWETAQVDLRRNLTAEMSDIYVKG